MNATPITTFAPAAWTSGASAKRYARTAGVLLLVSFVAGAVGEAYVPSKIIVPNDAAATARNITAVHSLFRLGFASYLIEAVCDVALSLVFYVLLKPVGRNLALLAAFLGLVSTTLYAVAEAFYFAPSVILSGADYLKVFSPEQLNALALLSLRLFGRFAGIFMVFYGLAVIIRGYLIFHSGYLPRVLGILFALAGLGFVAQNVALVLAPAYASNFLLAPIFVAGPALMAWLLVKGVDVVRWDARSLAVATQLE
jgi:hypothetical protein